MKVRFSLNYINSPTMSRSETVDTTVITPLRVGDTIFMIRDEKEWEGVCTRVHHLFNEDEYSHLPMYWIDLKFIRKIK